MLFRPSSHESVLPSLCPAHASPYDYSECATLIDRAAQTTPEWVGRGALERPGRVPHEMTEHPRLMATSRAAEPTARAVRAQSLARNRPFDFGASDAKQMVVTWATDAFRRSPASTSERLARA